MNMNGSGKRISGYSELKREREKILSLAPDFPRL